MKLKHFYWLLQGFTPSLQKIYMPWSNELCCMIFYKYSVWTVCRWRTVDLPLRFRETISRNCSRKSDYRILFCIKLCTENRRSDELNHIYKSEVNKSRVKQTKILLARHFLHEESRHRQLFTSNNWLQLIDTADGTMTTYCWQLLVPYKCGKSQNEPKQWIVHSDE
jgi:hypothetical protein